VAAEVEFFDALGPSDRADLRRLLETLLDTHAAVNPDLLELHN
jgi:hypothetical protein